MPWRLDISLRAGCAGLSPNYADVMRSNSDRFCSRSFASSLCKRSLSCGSRAASEAKRFCPIKNSRNAASFSGVALSMTSGSFPSFAKSGLKRQSVQYPVRTASLHAPVAVPMPALSPHEMHGHRATTMLGPL